MTKFPSSEETVCNSLLVEAKPILHDLAREMKIDDLSEDFLKEIVVPISLYFDNKFPRSNNNWLGTECVSPLDVIKKFFI